MKTHNNIFFSSKSDNLSCVFFLRPVRSIIGFANTTPTMNCNSGQKSVQKTEQNRAEIRMQTKIQDEHKASPNLTLCSAQQARPKTKHKTEANKKVQKWRSKMSAKLERTYLLCKNRFPRCGKMDQKTSPKTAALRCRANQTNKATNFGMSSGTILAWA